MGLMSKLKDMFLEEADEDDIQINDNRNKKEEQKEKLVRKIEFPRKKERQKEKEEEVEEPIAVEIEKETVNEIESDDEIKEEELEEEQVSIIYDDDDFIEDTIPIEDEEEHKLYGGNSQKKEITKRDNKRFEPSPVISPVYGVLSKNYSKDDFDEKKDLDHLFIDERKKKITFDSVRQKAYGDLTEDIESTLNIPLEPKQNSILYDMEEEKKEPVVEEVTLGDAEEYFSDLGLEYNVDYIDSGKKTRTEKNKELSDFVEKEVEKTKKTAGNNEEKNLYDLIDMMYENKEE